MKLDYKIYQAKELIAATATATSAAHMAYATPQAVIKYAGRVVWNEIKDGSYVVHTKMVAVIQGRVDHHRRQLAAKYIATYGSAPK